MYREGDRILKILTDLIDGTQLFDQTPSTRELETSRMQTRVYTALVNAALAENDFNSAYDTCVNKLSPLTMANPNDAAISGTAWSAFSRTGNFTYRPTTRTAIRTSIPSNSTYDLQRMELLARAMLICPKEEIEGIVRNWMVLEDKTLHPDVVQPPSTTSASTQMLPEHRGFLATAAQVGRSVARTASPLIHGTMDPNMNTDVRQERASGELSGWGTSSSRFGVRDTVKTGLTQGIGWLLGATPVQEDSDHNNGTHT